MIDHARLTDQGDHLDPRLTPRAEEEICDEGMPRHLSPQIPIRLTPLADHFVLTGYAPKTTDEGTLHA